jgi:hypothetical protein
MISPKQGWPKNLGTPEFLVGMLLLACAIMFYYFAVFRVDYAKTMLLDLAPYPDATEYFAQAKALRNDGWPSIQIGYDKLPSRYPFGYPVLMLPWLRILPAAHDVLAPFRTNQTLGFLLLLAVFAFYVYLAMPLTGGFAALLLATLPGFFTFCRSSLSEISGAFFIVLAFMFTYLGLEEQRRWKLYLSSVLLGLSINIRLQSVFFAPLLLAMALFPAKGAYGRWFLHCAAVCLLFVLAASPVLVFNTINFHSPFKTGYDFWTPYFGEKHLLFSVRYVPRNALMLWKQATLQPHSYEAANLFGTGTCFVPAFLLLSCAGFVFIPRSRFLAAPLFAASSSVAASLCYLFGSDARFYLPVLMLLVALAVLPVAWAANRLFQGKNIVISLLVFTLFIATCLGYPSRSGYDTSGIDRSQAWDAIHFTTTAHRSVQFLAQRDFARRFNGQPAIVLSDIDPVYLNALLPHSYIAAPIDGNHHYKWSYTWRYDRPQALALVERALAQSLPVHALFVPRDATDSQQARLPAITGYEWHADTSSKQAKVLTIAPIGPKETMSPAE